MSPLSSGDRRALLELARRAIVEAAHRRPVPPVLLHTPELARPGGAFVSLHQRGRLRGCIGQMEALEPLAQTVARCAAAAATEDPRFAPVQPQELDELEIEISVLSPLFPISPEQVEVGRHGLLVSRGWQRGVLLPQVAAEFRWTPQRFLEETCRKAGLEADALRDPATRIQAFTAEVFSEAETRSEPRARAS
jgi:AmmeMemoRadiSam system protein A